MTHSGAMPGLPIELSLHRNLVAYADILNGEADRTASDPIRLIVPMLERFIASDRGGKDIFVHASALQRGGIMGLAENQRVAVDVADGQKGPEAVSLRLI